ncbi:maleylpyruvate isomerase family mycothiol-dependent enzyme, partial [Streptomonospora algeriensis]
MSLDTRLGEPIDARGLFGPERAALLELLGGLDSGRWQAGALPGWSVRDVAAHLLGDDYSRLAWAEGHDTGEGPRPGEAFEAFIHRMNREWVQASRRISPPLLMETLELTGRRIARLWAGSDLHAAGRPVSWAGADPAPLWLDCARDLTEYWAHRQQIRAAIGLRTEDTAPAPPVLAVVLDTFMRALPHTLRDTPAPAGTRVRVA